jgi:Glycosyltransferase family 87
MPSNHKAPTTGQIRIAVVLTAVVFFLTMLGTREAKRADFSAFYADALIFRQGHTPKLYDLYEQERVQENLLKRPGLLVDPYPPFHVFLIAPLIRLGYRGAYLAWGVVNILLFLVPFQALMACWMPEGWRFRCLVLSSLFFPVWVALIQGQFSIFILVSFTVAFICLRRRREYLSGLALGLGLLKFTIVLPFAVILLLCRKWRFIAGLSTAAGILGLVSLFMIGLPGMLAYGHLLLDMLVHPSNPAYAPIKPWDMPTILGFIMGILGKRISPHSIVGLSAGISGGLIVVTAWLWWRQNRKGNEAGSDLMFAGALVVALVTTPHLYAHDLTLMILPVILVVASPQWAAKPRERGPLMLVIAGLYASPVYLAVLAGRELLFVLAPVLLTFALATFSLAKNGSGPPASSSGQSDLRARAASSVGVTS